MHRRVNVHGPGKEQRNETKCHRRQIENWRNEEKLKERNKIQLSNTERERGREKKLEETRRN